MAEIWASVPGWFWAGMLFVLGAAVGSFLNVCIYRMPRGESLMFPGSHCPGCNYAIPWYHNIPLYTWLYLRARCAHCGTRISARYFLVELLTAVAFLGCWFAFGKNSLGPPLVYSLFLAGLIAATFIDFEHYIIPDEITLGGVAVGFVCSFAVPELHDTANRALALKSSFFGIVAGAGIVYLVLRIGKLLFGRQKMALEGETRIVFSETGLVLPDKSIPYEDLFYRKSDAITLQATFVELIDRCYKGVPVRLSPERLTIGEEEFDPEKTPHMEVLTTNLTLPREAMGLGDVKFMAAIGAFLGWKAVLFSLMASSMIGAVVGVFLIAIGRQEWSGRLPYGPYIALAAVIWMFGGWRIMDFFFPTA